MSINLKMSNFIHACVIASWPVSNSQVESQVKKKKHFSHKCDMHMLELHRRSKHLVVVFVLLFLVRCACGYMWVCSLSSLRCRVSAGWTSPTRLHHLPHCLLADAPHSDMCVPAHLFRPHYCQACVNKYPGVERSSVPVLHHRGAQSAGRPLLSCSRADRNHDYTVSTVVIHLLPKLRHCTLSCALAQEHVHMRCSCTCTDIRTGTHTHTDKQILTDICSFIPFFSPQCNLVCR